MRFPNGKCLCICTVCSREVCPIMIATVRRREAMAERKAARKAGRRKFHS